MSSTEETTLFAREYEELQMRTHWTNQSRISLYKGSTSYTQPPIIPPAPSLFSLFDPILNSIDFDSTGVKMAIESSYDLTLERGRVTMDSPAFSTYGKTDDIMLVALVNPVREQSRGLRRWECPTEEVPLWALPRG